MRRKHPDKEDLQYYSLSLGGYSYREIAAIFGVSVRTAWKGVQRARKAEADRAEAERALADAVAVALTTEATRKKEPREPSWTRDAVVNFGCRPYTPDTPCAHDGPYPAGSDQYCPNCHQSGRDGDPALRIDPAFAPKPEPKPAPRAVPLTRESKKQRRKRERREAAKARPTTKAA